MIKDFIKTKAPFLVGLFQLLRLSLKERTLMPTKVRLVSGHILFSNPLEPRGRLLLLNSGRGQPAMKRFWSRAIDIMEPEVVIDCGANYGEVLFNKTYPVSTKMAIGIEADPSLIPYLNRSKAVHPDASKIKIINALASNESKQQVDFFIDRSSSGRSSALQTSFVRKKKKIKVPSIKVDEFILESISQPASFVFKIDVEGFEPQVLEGMAGLWNGGPAVGCVEFDTRLLRLNLTDLSTYYELLFNRFQIVCSMTQTGKVKQHRLLEFQDRFIQNKEDIVTDLLLFTDHDLFNQIILNDLGSKEKFNG